MPANLLCCDGRHSLWHFGSYDICSTLCTYLPFSTVTWTSLLTIILLASGAPFMLSSYIARTRLLLHHHTFVTLYQPGSLVVGARRMACSVVRTSRASPACSGVYQHRCAFFVRILPVCAGMTRFRCGCDACLLMACIRDFARAGRGWDLRAAFALSVRYCGVRQMSAVQTGIDAGRHPLRRDGIGLA